MNKNSNYTGMSILVSEFGSSNKLTKVKRYLALYFGMDSNMIVHLMQHSHYSVIERNFPHANCSYADVK